MKKTTNIEPLDILADKANFGDVDDKQDIISVMGRKLNEYLKGQKRMFYLWEKFDPEGIWPNVEIVTFDNPNDYSNVKMYKIKGEDLDNTIKNGSMINLSKQIPVCSGKKVVKVLKKYAKRWDNKNES